MRRSFVIILAVILAGLVSATTVFFVLRPKNEAPTPPVAVEEVPAPVKEPIRGWLEVSAESPIPPSRIEIYYDGTLLVKMEDPGFFSAHGGEFLFPTSGVTFGIYARWDDYLPGPRAIRFKATFEGTEVSTYSLWGQDQEASGTWRLPAIELAPPEEPAPTEPSDASSSPEKVPAQEQAL